MEIWKGDRCSWQEGVAIGRLCFTEAMAEVDREAILWVSSCCPSRLPSPSVVGVVITLGEGGNAPVVPSLNCPMLTLPYLDPCLDGQIAILDSRRKTLFVSPNLETLSCYDPRRELGAEGASPFFYRRVVKIPKGEGDTDGWLWEGEVTEEEETLFENYRAAAEHHPGTPWMICASAKDPVLLRRQLRAVYRGAVFGRFSLLFTQI